MRNALIWESKSRSVGSCTYFLLLPVRSKESTETKHSSRDGVRTAAVPPEELVDVGKELKRFDVEDETLDVIGV